MGSCHVPWPRYNAGPDGLCHCRCKDNPKCSLKKNQAVHPLDALAERRRKSLK